MGHKIKILAVFCALALVSACKTSTPRTPTVPETPQPEYTDVIVTLDIGVNVTNNGTYAFGANDGTYTFDIFVGPAGQESTKLTTLTFPGNSQFKQDYTFRILTASTGKIYAVKYKLTAGETTAIYQYWVQVKMVSLGYWVDPTTLQSNGPFSGWNLNDIKELDFKIKKLGYEIN